MVDDELQGFADAATLKSRYGASSHAFLLGLAHPDHEVNFPVEIEDDRHLFIMAGSQAGKGNVAKESVEAYLEDAPETDGGLAKDAYALLQDAGSFSTTLSRQLQFLANLKIQKHLKNDGFTLAQAVRENWSIYVCLPPAQIARMKRWMRALVRVALEAKMVLPICCCG
jgi:hypothetical protein